MTMSAVPKSAPAPTADLARRVQDGDRDAFAALMRRFNRRLFRTARAILKDDAAAEDAETAEEMLLALGGVDRACEVEDVAVPG